jgi:hypothetical protein
MLTLPLLFLGLKTPRAHGFGWRSRTDYLRFHVVLRVPVDAKALAFEGMTTTMSLRVEGGDGKHDPSYRSFDYTTRNSPIEFAVRTWHWRGYSNFFIADLELAYHRRSTPRRSS